MAVTAGGAFSCGCPGRALIRDGREEAEPEWKAAFTEETKRLLTAQKERYPLMNEEDVVKFVFQGMLGVGHLIRSGEEALKRLRAEMVELEPDGEEALLEEISPEWVRMNLRAAKAEGITEEEIAERMCRSVQEAPLPLTRQDVYYFCVRLDGSESMKQAAARLLDESWLPGHSRQYREAYHPAYRVLRGEEARRNATERAASAEQSIPVPRALR